MSTSFCLVFFSVYSNNTLAGFAHPQLCISLCVYIYALHLCQGLFTVFLVVFPCFVTFINGLERAAATHAQLWLQFVTAGDPSLSLRFPSSVFSYCQASQPAKPANVYTRSRTFCWSSTNHQAFALYCLSAAEIWVELRRPACASLFVFDLPFGSETCSHAVCSNFPVCCFSQLPHFKNA